MSDTLSCRDFFVFSREFVVNHFKDFFYRLLDPVDLLDGDTVLFNVLLVLLLILLYLLLKVFLLFFLFKVNSKPLIFVDFNFSLESFNLCIKMFGFFLQFVNKSVQREVAFLCLYEILNKFVEIFYFCLLYNLFKHSRVLLQFLLWNKTHNFIIDLSFFNPLLLHSSKFFLLHLSSHKFLFKLNLLLLLLLQNKLVCFFFQDLLIDSLHVFVKLLLLILSLFNQIL